MSIIMARCLKLPIEPSTSATSSFGSTSGRVLATLGVGRYSFASASWRMVNACEKEPQGKIPHFYTARFVVTVGEHTLEVGPGLFNASLLWVFFTGATVMGNVPPVTLACFFT